VIQLLYTILAFVAAISILVVVHELGHYWVAKRLGVKVLRFSVGFGKPLWMRRFGKDRTEWVLAAIPLGGYVKMLDEHEGKVTAKELPRAFNRQPLWRRSAIVLAGPLANFLFAIVAYTLVNLAGIDGIRPVVGKVAAGSLAAHAGFSPGDELLAVDGRALQAWDERRLYLYEKALDRAGVRFTVRDRDRLLQERVLDLSSLSPGDVGAGLLERHIGLSPMLPELLAIIGQVEAGGPAAQAGLRAGDRILAVDGKPVHAWAEVVAAVSARPGESLALRAMRGSEILDMRLTTLAVEREGQRIGRIGVAVQIPELPAEMRVTVRYPLPGAVGEGAETTWRMSVLTLKMLVKMLKLEVSTKTISGPLTIAQYAGASAQVGVDRFVLFLAVVSISLGVLNLLPVPVLDGGHLLFYLAEAVLGRPLPERAQHWGQQIGIALLILLMMLAFYNDIVRLLN
jgi:regulator of sigma E protease